MLETWFVAFCFTQLIECPIYRIPLKSSTRPWVMAFCISGLTHPFFFLALPWLLGKSIWGPLWIIEAMVVIIEAILLRAMGVQRALPWSFVANGASLLTGGIFRLLWGWP